MCTHYIQVKKAKTHYTNYRNQGVNPHDISRTLHRQWFDIINFPTSRELESLGICFEIKICDLVAKIQGIWS